jgi:predicted glycoside hydrolase/deacetylase ChbG (UPF0249 family)
MRLIITFQLIILSFSVAHAQKTGLAELLGYAPDAKLLIIHADDAGVSHSTNQAVFDAFEKGNINSTAIMVPCPWFPEIATYAGKHPEFDYGIHLTFSSEWFTYKWGGVASSDKIRSLLTRDGYFYATTEEAVKASKPAEVETELRAQIDKVIAAGIKPSHFDSHMLTTFGSPELFKIYLKLGEEYKVPVFLPKSYSLTPEFLEIPELKNHYFIDVVFEAPTEINPAHWDEYYTNLLHDLKPGVNELIFHLAYYTDETKAMTQGHDYYNADWRKRDTDFAASENFRKTLRENNIILITWKQIQMALYPAD